MRPRLQAGQGLTITRIAMADSLRGWALGVSGQGGEYVVRTEDGGGSWRDVSPPEPASEGESEIKQAAAFFLDATRAWVSYPPHEVVWRTVDGGATWQSTATPFAGGLGAALWFADRDHGWLMKFLDAGMHHVYAALFRTADGGLTWLLLFDPYTGQDLQSFSKTGMAFADANYGWVTRDSGGVQPGAFVDVTTDGGLTWQSLPLPPPEGDPDKFSREFCGMHDPILRSRGSGVLVVTCARFEDSRKIESHFLFSTSDGGATWGRFDYPGGRLLLVDDVAFALGRDIYASRDGGRSWAKIKTVLWDGQFSFVDEQTAWAVARSADETALVKTTDGGRSWALLEPQVVGGTTGAPGPAGGTAVVEGRATPMGGGRGQIAFISWRDNPKEISPSDIFLMNIDGSQLTKLTDGSGLIFDFTWSPDGERIAFSSDRDGDMEIYVINSDGSGLTQLTRNTAGDSLPAWSPRGDRIAFVSGRDGDSQIYLMNADGSGVRRIRAGLTPAWSPDGAQLAYAVVRDGLFVMNADGSGVRRLTDSSQNHYDWYPTWSPDGKSILFASNRHAPGDALTESAYLINADGTGLGRLTHAWGMPPYAWSPDGTLVAYTVDFFSSAQIRLLSRGGAGGAWMVEIQGIHPRWRP